MRPPADRQLDLSGKATDVAIARLCGPRVRWWVVLALTTLLGLFSTLLAWQYTVRIGGQPDVRILLFLNLAYWYLWAVFTPAIVCLAQRYRFEWQGLTRALLVHVPAVIVFSLAHIAAMAGVQWAIAASRGARFFWWEEVQRSVLRYFDWEMMTYWTIVGLSHAVLYYRESKRRAQQAARLEAQLVDAELKTLQQQLHPHFLFNTLNAISALMHRDVETADRTLMCLSDLLRLSLEHSAQPAITLADELEFLGKYAQIEQARFADRLTVRYDIDPETLDTLVPSLILQPLVENAIKHGLSKKAGPGHIDVRASRENGKLVLEVRDDGVGLSEDALTALQKGIGVSTTRARLQRLFGADHRFEFHRQPAGLSVLIAIPWRTAHATAGSQASRHDEPPPHAPAVGTFAGAGGMTHVSAG